MAIFAITAADFVSRFTFIAYGADMVMTDWQRALADVGRQPGVVAAAPFVQTKALVRRGSSGSFSAVFVKGIPPAGRESPDVTSIRRHATVGDFSFAANAIEQICNKFIKTVEQQYVVQAVQSLRELPTHTYKVKLTVTSMSSLSMFSFLRSLSQLNHNLFGYCQNCHRMNRICSFKLMSKSGRICQPS